MKRTLSTAGAALAAMAVTLFPLLPRTAAQSPPVPTAMDRINRDRARQMLRDAYDNLKKHYYDTKFHGLDMEARFKAADAGITNAASLGQSFGLVAEFFDGLNDSHTFFRPPSRPTRTDYGFHIQMYGERAFIARVRPGTDAEAKLRVGDEVLAYNGYDVKRETLWKVNYLFSSIAPQGASRLTVHNPAGETREVTAQAYTRQMKRVLDLSGGNGEGDLWQLVREEENYDHNVRQRYTESEGAMIWRCPSST